METIFLKNESIIDAVSFASGTEKGLPQSGELTGLELRLSKVLIKDNKTPKIWPLPGLSQLYLVVMVISDLDTPVQNLDLKGFPKVDDNEELPIDRTILYWKEGEGTKVPSQFHVLVSVIKSKEALRNTGEVLASVKTDSDYTDLVSSIKTIIAAGNAVGQISDSLLSLASVVGKHLGNVKDKPLMTWIQSFTDLNGDHDTLGKTVIEKENNNVAMAMTLIVRDKTREEKALNEQPKSITDEISPAV